MTLRKDCKCPCHGGAAVHVHPCCGPGSAGWPHDALLPDRDPYEALSLFGNEKSTKASDSAPSDKPAVKKS